jgi:hypothetical protein
MIDSGATRGSLCTTTCTDNVDCPSRLAFAGVCLAVGSDPLLRCYVECSADADCPVGNVCNEIALTTGGSDFVCLPDNAP